jgi:hypothetical protein
VSVLTIGRVGIDVDLVSVSGMELDSSILTISGQTAWGSVTNALTIEQQLNGYVDSPDESFVPVTWSERPTVDGFYRVRSAVVRQPDNSAFAGVFTFQVQLERVSGFAAPQIEMTATGKQRAQTGLPDLVNLIVNSSAETGIASTTASNCTMTQNTGWAANLPTNPYNVFQTAGTSSFRLASPTTNDSYLQPGGTTGMTNGMVAGKTYTVSGVIRLTAALGGTAIASRARAIYVTGTVGGVSTAIATSAQAVNVAGETRLSVTFTLPVNTTEVFLRFYLGHTAGTVDWDALSLVEYPTLVDYFDGSTFNTSDGVTTWTGTAHASTSLRQSLVTARPMVAVPGNGKSLLATQATTGLSASPYGLPIPTSDLGVTTDSSIRIFNPAWDQFYARYYVAPADHYQAAATLRVGAVLYVATGRQIPNTPTAWKLSNGLIEVRPSSSFASGTIFEIRNFAAGAWSSWQTITVGKPPSGVGNNPAPYATPHSITVLRNSPEVVTIRLLSNVLGIAVGSLQEQTPTMLDLTLRRGAQFVSVQISSGVDSATAITQQGQNTARAIAHGFIVDSTGLFILSAKSMKPVFNNGLSLELVDPLQSKQWAFGFGKTANLNEAGALGTSPRQEYFWAGSETGSVVRT